MKKKILALAMAAIMLIVAVVGGTLAYFTDSDAENNVFTVGNIDIDLREHKDDQLKDDFEDVTGVMPGVTYNKLIDVKNVGDNDAYVKVTIVIPENMTPVWNDDATWKADDENPTSGSGTYVFYNTSKLEPDAKTAVLLKAVTLDATVTELNVEDKYEVKVSVAAIQADSFDNVDVAMEAFQEQYVATTILASDVDKINNALSADKEAMIVQLPDDIKSREMIVMAKNNSVFDGNGNALTKDASGEHASLNLGIKTVGGTIKNMTITGTGDGRNLDGNGFRAIYIDKPTNDVIIDNVKVIKPSLYTINTGAAGEAGLTLTVKDSVLDGWTSVGDVFDYVEFKNVEFGSNGTYAMSRNYVENVVYNGCTFVKGFSMDANQTGLTIELNNCNVVEYDTEGNVVSTTPVTAADFESLLFTAAGAGEYFNATDLKECTVVVDGVTVAW